MVYGMNWTQGEPLPPSTRLMASDGFIDGSIEPDRTQKPELIDSIQFGLN
jgi:hypothetical protein